MLSFQAAKSSIIRRIIWVITFFSEENDLCRT